METKSVTWREQEEQSSQMSHSLMLSSQKKKKTFTSSDEEASYSDYYPIIPGDLMSVKELLNFETYPLHSTWLLESQAEDEEYWREKYTLFGNEAEKVEIDVIRNQQAMRVRADRKAFRRQAEKKAAEHLRYLEALSQRAPDFPVPLRAHMVWEGMAVKLCCTLSGTPPPRVTWYKDGVPLSCPNHPWNYTLRNEFGLCSLEIRRCSLEDAGDYKVVARSMLGEASTWAKLVVNTYRGAVAGSDDFKTPAPPVAQDAQFATTFPPTWVTEGGSLTLRCGFTSALLLFQQDVTWFRDGVQLRASDKVSFQVDSDSASVTLAPMHKEQEGVYTARLRTWNGVQDHSAYVYVTDAASVSPGAPASPLALQVSDINRDYVYLSWQPPSADGASPVLGYYVERCDISDGQWVRCNEHVQKLCHYPVFGLKEGATYQFRVCAVNQAGVGRPSKATEPIVTSDPLEPSRTMVVKADRGREITITKDQLEGEVLVPFPPTGVHACEVSDTYVVLSWTEPDPRGRELLTYYVERSAAGSDSWHLASLDVEVSSTRFPLFDLQKGKQYCFRVRSVNQYGVSDPSQPSAPIALGRPLAPPAPPTSVMPIRDTDTSVVLKWEEPKNKDDVMGYYLYYSEVGTQDWKTVNNKPFPGTRFTVHSLEKNKEYVFRAKSVGRAGNSDYSEESDPILVKAAISVPSPPRAVALLLCTGSEMILGWRAPASNGGDPVRGYFLDQKKKGAGAWREVNTAPARERKYKVCSLTRGNFYQFRVFAANMAGVGKPCEASEAFLCEEWTFPEPGCPYDLEFREVRDNSLVLLWAAPLYEGQSPVIGYLVEVSQGDQSETWTAVHEEPITETLYRMEGLQAGQTYRFRVSAINQAGVGMASLPSEPITALTRPGTKDIEIGVDNDGFIFLSYEATDMSDSSEFLWKKNFQEAIDSGRADLDNKGNRSVLTFKDASEEDLGVYSVEMSDNPDLSSSYDFTAEDLDRLKELSWQVRHPLIGLRSGWQVEVSETGSVRLWLQTEPLSKDAELRLIFNDKEISSDAHRKINFDKAAGLVEILFEQLSLEDEGSYTAQLVDGRAKNQLTLVFVDQKFRQTIAQAAANRRDFQRRSGPYFQEFLSWTVTEDCELVIKGKVTNMNKDTTLKWSKDGREVTEVMYDASSGACALTIPQVTQAEAGVYRAVVADGRGEDESVLDLTGKEFDKLLQHLSKQCALTAGPIRIQCTPEGFKLYCSIKYYLNHLKTSWYLKEKRIDQEARAKPGATMQKVWVEILDPTERDRGMYTLEMFDGLETHKRQLDLTGQAFDEALLEYQRLKQVAIADKNRGRVVKGLPDVVAIMEGKSLCLTCMVDGDPIPDVFWLKNDREVSNHGKYNVDKEPKCSTLTVNDVTMEDSGNYSVFVRNKYGSQTVYVTVSVYKIGEMPRADAIEFD